jgi:hypothetical protein
VHQQKWYDYEIGRAKRQHVPVDVLSVNSVVEQNVHLDQ